MIDERRLGRVRLAPGITRGAMRTFYFAALFSTCLMAFMSFAQPFVLGEVLHVPRAEQGAVTGTLAVYGELVIIACIGVAGAVSDRVGRRAVYATGFVVMGVAYLAYPFASAIGSLALLRALFAVGAACVSSMLATVVADYAAAPDRGKATGTMGVMNGVGVLVALFGLTRLPEILQRRGLGPLAAGRATYAVAAGLCMITAVVLARGLAPRVVSKAARPPWRTLAREGIVAARNPAVLLAYGAAFVSRGDLAVVGTFLTLWVSHDAAERGMDATHALATAGMIAGISQTAAFVWAPVIGVLADRMNRVATLAVALALATAGYGSMYFVTVPTGGKMIAGVCLIGVGEISALIASQVLIAEHAPASTRGSVIGAFGLCGAVGILVASKVGGHLFDAWARSGPFVLMGALNFVVLVWALVVLRAREPATAAAVARGT